MSCTGGITIVNPRKAVALIHNTDQWSQELVLFPENLALITLLPQACSFLHVYLLNPWLFTFLLSSLNRRKIFMHRKESRLKKHIDDVSEVVISLAQTATFERSQPTTLLH